MTDVPYNPPSGDPADEGSLSGLLRLFSTKTAQQTDDMLPARIIAYDRARNRATVQPMIMMGTTDGQKVSRAQIADVPVLQMGAGDFVLSFPVKPDDLGWIKASDRDISLFMQGLGEEWPNTTRLHSFQDGLFIPDRLRDWVLNGEDAERVVLSSADGTTRIAVGTDTIAITAAASVTITAPAVTITSAATRIEGPLVVTGGITGADGIVLETHRHGGVTTGAGTSGVPVP